MRTASHDLTQGNILSRLLAVAIPIMGTQLMQMLYNLTDMFWLGQGVGPAVVAASGSAGMYLWLSMAFLFVGRMGAEIGVSQNLGRQDPEAAQAYAQTALWIAIALGIAFGLVMLVFATPLIGFFGIRDAAVARDASDYLRIVAIGIPMTFVSGAVAGTFNGAGNSRVSFLCNVSGLVVNMILDPVMILWWHMGIQGAALATIIGQAVVCALFVVMVHRHRSRPFAHFRFSLKPVWAHVRQVFQWSAPIGLESMFFTLLAMVVSRLVAAFGTEAIAVQHIGSQIESLTWLIGGGFGSAVTAFVGQNFGARKWGRIRAGYRTSILAMMVWGVAVTALLALCGHGLYLVFQPDPGIASMGATYLRILSICQILSCMEAVSAGCFRGIGKTVPPSVVSITSNAIRVPLAYFLSRTALGLDGIWWAVALSCVLRGVWVNAWYWLASRRNPHADEGRGGDGAAAMEKERAACDPMLEPDPA